MATNILVVQTAFLGDVLLSIPLLKTIRSIDTESNLTLICREGFGEFFRQTGLAQKVVEVKKSSGNSYERAIAEISDIEWDVIVSPHQSFRSAFLVSKLKAKTKIGFSRWWNFLFFDQRIRRPMELPDALRQLALLRPLLPVVNSGFHEIEQLVAQDPKALLHLHSDEKRFKIPSWASMRIDFGAHGAQVQKRLGLGDSKIIFLAPGSVWATKKWTREGFIGVGQEFSKRGYKVILIGSPPESPECEELSHQIPESLSIAGQLSLYDLCALLQTGRVLISNDNGAMHLGSVSGIPTVAVFGPTSLAFGYRPWNDQAIVVEDDDLACRPCGIHGHQECPIGTHACMRNVGFEQVVQAADSLLS